MLMRKALIFVERDFIIESSYKVGFLLELLASVFPVFSFYFVSKLVDGGQSEHLAKYGGRYFPFVLVGLAFTQYFALALGTFSTSIRRAQMAGCLEAMLSTRTRPELIIILSSLYAFLSKTIHIALVLGIGGFFLGADFSQANVPAAAIAIVLTVLAFSSVGIFSAAVTMVLKKGNPVEWLVGSLSSLLGGAFFPVDTLPPWMQKLAAFVPLTHALEATRLAVLRGYSPGMLWKQFLILGAMAVLLFPVSVLLFSRAVHMGRRDGTLMQY